MTQLKQLDHLHAARNARVAACVKWDQGFRVIINVYVDM